MGVQVRLRSLELDPTSPRVLEFITADHWVVHNDHTLEVVAEDGEAIAHVHHDRWEVVMVSGTGGDVKAREAQQ